MHTQKHVHENSHTHRNKRTRTLRHTHAYTTVRAKASQTRESNAHGQNRSIVRPFDAAAASHHIRGRQLTKEPSGYLFQGCGGGWACDCEKNGRTLPFLVAFSFGRVMCRFNRRRLLYFNERGGTEFKKEWVENLKKLQCPTHTLIWWPRSAVQKIFADGHYAYSFTCWNIIRISKFTTIYFDLILENPKVVTPTRALWLNKVLQRWGRPTFDNLEAPRHVSSDYMRGRGVGVGWTENLNLWATFCIEFQLFAMFRHVKLPRSSSL